MASSLTDTRSIIRSFYKIIMFFSLIVGTAILVGMFSYGYIDYKKSLENESTTVDSVVDSHLRLLFSEIYLNQKDAINLRLLSISDSINGLLSGRSVCSEVISAVSSFKGDKVCTKNFKESDRLSWHESPLLIGSIDFGKLRIGVQERELISEVMSQRFITIFLFVSIIGLLTTITLVRVMRIKVLDRFVARLKEESQNLAIARTAQQMAHDVRAPFSLVQGILSTISNLKNADDIKFAAKDAIPHVERSIHHVNDMIRDIMEVGKDTLRATCDHNIEEFIDLSLKDCFAQQSRIPIEVSYKLEHQHKVNVDPVKIKRLFANLVNNALDAMANLEKGQLWFRTKEISIKDQNFLECTIGNLGHLDANDIANIFEPFFTKGKEAGTGLGLAVVRNAVESHGCSIRCEAPASNQVEFIFTLPLSSVERDFSGKLKERFTLEAKSPSTLFNFDAPDKNLPKIYLIEDEIWFQHPWSLAASGRYQIVAFETGESFLKDIQNLELGNCVVITDYYLGSGMNGVELAEKIKIVAPELTIMLCTDSNENHYSKELFVGRIPKNAEEGLKFVDDFLKHSAQS